MKNYVYYRSKLIRVMFLMDNALFVVSKMHVSIYNIPCELLTAIIINNTHYVVANIRYTIIYQYNVSSCQIS